MTQAPFNRVAIMARKHIASLTDTIAETVNLLQTKGINVVLEEETAREFGTNHCHVVPSISLHQHADLICVIGGDGSLLHAAKTALEQDLPIIGVNRGKLGFLADITPQHLETLIEVVQGEYLLENRFLFDMTLVHNNTTLYQSVALNDVVLQQGLHPQMIDFNTSVDGTLVCNQKADGLVVATPTGSTAYSLSGGGPILHPQLKSVVMMPMFPHKLSSRPIVIEGTSIIDVHVLAVNKHPPRVSCDGQESQTVPLDSHIIIREEPRKLKLVHPRHYDYFETLRQKLGWENKPNLS